MTSRRQRVVFATAAIAMTAGTACSSGTTPAEPPSTPSSSRSPSVTSSADPDPESTPTPRPERVTIAVAGDIHFEGVLRNRLEDPSSALSPAGQALSAADVAVVNLETAVGSGGRPEPGKRFTFQAPPAAFAALAAVGVDVATMANNHVLDFGRASLRSTFAAIARSPLAVVGVGRDADEAFRPARTDVSGTTVATLGATVAGSDPTADPTGQWAATATAAGTADAIEPARLLRAVASADRTADVIVVYLHWGVQGERCPSGDQRSLAAEVVAAGADVVVGSHTHQLQGDGRLGQGYVAYGLGNYAWYTQNAETSSTGVLTLQVQPPRSRQGRAEVTAARWAPARIDADGLPRPVSGDEAADFAAERRSLRACAGLDPPRA